MIYRILKQKNESLKSINLSKEDLLEELLKSEEFKLLIEKINESLIVWKSFQKNPSKYLYK